MAFLNCLTPLGKGVFLFSHEACHLWQISLWRGLLRLGFGHEKQVSSWEGDPQPLGVEKGKTDGLPKTPVRSVCSKTIDCPRHMRWWPLQHPPPHCNSFGPGDGSIGGCYRQLWMTGTHPHRRKEASKSTRNLQPSWTWPADRVPGVGGGCIGRVGQHVGGSQGCYNWNSLSSTRVFILESLKELWICQMRIRLRWRAQEQSSSLWQAIYYGWLAGLKSECNSSLCLL